MLDTKILTLIAHHIQRDTGSCYDARNIRIAIDELHANRARIAELEAENAKIRRVIGEIPDGESCDGCSNITDRFNGDDQCSLFYLNEVGERCKSCLAAFPNGNKGE